MARRVGRSRTKRNGPAQGGCPEFRNDVIDIVEATATTIVLDEADPDSAGDAIARDIFAAAPTYLFDPFRRDVEA